MHPRRALKAALILGRIGQEQHALHAETDGRLLGGPVEYDAAVAV